MKYELGNMDRYSIAVNGSVMENSSYMKATLDETVDAEKLMRSVKAALDHHPLFKCKMSYKKQYFLEDNDNAEIVLFNADTGDKCRAQGKRSENYS